MGPVYPADNLPCALLREGMAGGDAVALMFGIMTQEAGNVLLAEEFVTVAKEGMHHGAVLRVQADEHPQAHP